jgi:predicted methyltransferase
MLKILRPGAAGKFLLRGSREAPCISIQKIYIQKAERAGEESSMAKRSLIRFDALLALIMLFAAACTTQDKTQDYTFALSNPERPASEKELDAARKPAEVLAFYGVNRGQKVADIMAFRGYYTAILSQVVGTEGVVYSVNPTARPEFNDRWKKPGYENVKIVDGPLDKVALPQDGSLDFVIIHLNYHDLAPNVRIAMNKRILGALKSGGIYGVVDHSAKDGTGNEAVKTLHRIDKQLVIKEVTGSGFTLAKEGTMLRKPEDTRDFNVNKVRNKDDRFVLAFQKP